MGRAARKPETEIEITPEMIEAGLERFIEHPAEPTMDQLRIALRDAFEAMLCAHRK